MGIRLIPPKGIFMGWRLSFRKFGIALLAHNLQCGRRWVFGLRIGRRILGYITRGDSTPDLLAYKEAGWYIFSKESPHGINM